MNDLLLFSGGMDSLCAWWLLHRPQAVYVRLGHPYQDDELSTLSRLSNRLPSFRFQVVSGPHVGPLSLADGHIPHRNLLMAATAAAFFPDATHIYLGALWGEASPDKSRRFFRTTSTALSVSEHRRTSVLAPFRGVTKTGLVRLYLKTGGDPDLLAVTRSCYEPGSGRYGCGRCQACLRRWVALRRNGLDCGPRPTWPDATVGNAWRNWQRAGFAATPGLVVNNVGALYALWLARDE